MLRDDTNNVALFIDWDNIAISIAADLNGAVPDIRAVVRVAQRHGTVLVARAYSEWQSSSDRLSVYCAGVEPVYAPTFRFEPDPVTQTPRGKSLADPCLVADCVDTLHLMPEITTFVLVSGDKDLVPVVRLTQLRGKRVVVVGPDYVAALLKDLADEYVPYRSLIESGEAIPAPQEMGGPGGGRRRRINGVVRGAAAIAPTAQPAPARGRQQPSPAPAPVASTPSPAPAIQAPIAPSAPAVSTVAPAATSPSPRQQREAPLAPPPRQREVAPPPVPEPEAEPQVEGPTVVSDGAERIKATEDVGPIFQLVATILREREAQGRLRLRATNLKDQLLARLPGFNERRYGFPRFQDFLAAAERARVIEVQRAGPVQWISRPDQPTPPTPSGLPAPSVQPGPELAAPAASPVNAPVAGEAAPEAELVPEPLRGKNLVRFICELRNRSRWLTFTYVLTNLISHIDQEVPQSVAETEARNALNRLVELGVLRVDREPRDIDVGGTKHRVRMCHIEDSHPLVREVMAELAASQAATGEITSAEAPSDATLLSDTEQPGEDTTSAEMAESTAEELAEPVAVEPAVPVPAGVEVPTSPPSPLSVHGPAQERQVQGHEQSRWTVRGSDSGLTSAVTPAEAAPAASPDQPTSEASAPAGVEMPTGHDAPSPAEVMAETVPVTAALPAEPKAAAFGRAPAVEDVAVPSPTESASEPATVQPRALTLPEVFQELQAIVRETTNSHRPTVVAATVKNRLGRRLGAFDEHAFGFSKFKDFLLAAEREGIIRVELAGPVTRVALPNGAPVPVLAGDE
ncbi:MAG: NYN domain-containing protein [Chloroflexi bacterium]|nr:NYN domain-containing protein [Chloroflexota bacterium]